MPNPYSNLVSLTTTTTTMPPLLTSTATQLRLLPQTLHHHHRLCHHHHHITNIKPLITSSSNNRFHFSQRILLLPPLKSASTNNSDSVQNNLEDSNERNASIDFLERLGKWIGLLPSIFPGGSWWNFSDDVDILLQGQPVTVWRAISKMWGLVSCDRPVFYAAFSALIIRSALEMIIPHFRSDSLYLLGTKCEDYSFPPECEDVSCLMCNIWNLQWDKKLLFCHCKHDSGLVKRMRETLYSSLLLQDISFFDNERVGGLTSRLGADCQQLSRVIGTHLNNILYNAIEIEGSLTYLLILSWPFGLSLHILYMLHIGSDYVKLWKVPELEDSKVDPESQCFS